MKHNKKDSFAGLLLIIIGACICLTVGLPFLTSILAIGGGLTLINYGLQLRGQTSLLIMTQRIVNEIHQRFF